MESVKIWREMRRPNARPPFAYQDLPDSERLSYRLLAWENFRAFLDLFGDDSSPFLDERFKSLEKLEEYASALLESGRYSFKHGCCDWLISRHDGTCIGVLHLYELNMEIWDGKHRPCMFGYAIAEPYRRQGYGWEAARHLLGHIPPVFSRYEVMAEPRIDNKPSRNLLEKLGFIEKRLLHDKQSSFWYRKLVEGEIPEAKADWD